MMRIQAACLDQTIRFETGEDHARYISDLQARQIPYRVDKEERKADGSVILSIRRQYNQYDCGEYLN